MQVLRSIRPTLSTIFSLSVENEQADAGRDGPTCLASQIRRRERRQGNVHFPCSADHKQDWQPYPVDPYSAISDDHTYIVERMKNILQVLRSIRPTLKDTS